MHLHRSPIKDSVLIFKHNRQTLNFSRPAEYTDDRSIIIYLNSKLWTVNELWWGIDCIMSMEAPADSLIDPVIKHNYILSMSAQSNSANASVSSCADIQYVVWCRDVLYSSGKEVTLISENQHQCVKQTQTVSSGDVAQVFTNSLLQSVSTV